MVSDTNWNAGGREWGWAKRKEGVIRLMGNDFGTELV